MRHFTITAAILAAMLALAACGGGGGSPPVTIEPDTTDPEPTQAEREAAEQAAREKAQREAEQAAREQEERERLAREEAEREEQERLAREEAERLAAEQERLERERLAREEAERQERERLAREEAERAAARLAFPYTPSGHYRIDGLSGWAADGAKHMPIYRDGERLFVGVDQGSKWVDTYTISDTGSPEFSIRRIERDIASALPVVAERGDVEIRHGHIADGVGQKVVAAFLADASAGYVQRWSAPPEVRIIGTTNPADIDRIVRAVQLVNVALPEDAKLSIGGLRPYFSLAHNVGQYGRYHRSGEEPTNAIDIEFVPAKEYRRGGNSAAVTWGLPVGEFAYIQFNMGAVSYSRDHEAVTLLAHEIMHALGFYGGGHVDPKFASIMEGTGAIHYVEQNGVRKPLSLLYPVDREALQALYGRLAPGDGPEDFGPWGSTAVRIDGNGPHANFGVALRNGYAEPWAYGPMPSTTLADNRALSGTATWEGTLLGLTPAAEAVAGDASIGVELATLTGAADFTSLETWTAGATPGAAGTGMTWLDGDLGYRIAVRGNTFRETGGDDGRLTGIFTGAAHEGAAGTLERTDLTAAFGASR